MSRRLSLPALIGTPLLLLAAGGAVGWFTTDDSSNTNNSELVRVGNADARLRPLNGAPNPLDMDESMVIGAAEYLSAANAIEVSANAELEVPVNTGSAAAAVDPTTLLPAPTAPAAPIALAEATAVERPVAAPTPSPTGVVREAIADDEPATPSTLRVSAPFAAVGVYAALCNEIEAGSVPDPQIAQAVRPTLAVLVNQPSTIALSGTWADGSTLEKTTMVTLVAHDQEWQRVLGETGEQATIVACLTLPIDEVRSHATNGIAQLRASVLAISAIGQADLNATVTLNVPAANSDPLFVEPVTFTGRGEQRRIDGVLYPTMHVHYAFLSDAVVPTGSALLQGQVRVVAEHAFVEGTDCAGWAANQQGIDRTHSGRFSVTSETRQIAGNDRPVTTVDGDVYLDPTLAGGWEGSFCVRLQATNPLGEQRSTLALRGAQVRSPRTATYEVGVLLDSGVDAIGEPVQVSWTSATGHGCASTTLLDGLYAQCTMSARLAPDGIDVRLTLDDTSAVLRVPVNFGYCNPDDPLDSSDGCNTGFSQIFDIPIGESVHLTLQVVRNAAPGVLWDDPSNALIVAPVE